MMHKTGYYIINGITLYRLIAAPFLIYLIFSGRLVLFKWLLALSFFTDLIDGAMARKFRVTSIFGSRLDSLADDLTIVSAIVGIFILKFNFIRDHFVTVSILLFLFLFQIVLALIKYRKVTSFHTYLAKAAMILQGSFCILIFFLKEPPVVLFYAAALVTALDLIEEIVLVFILPKWKANVKGIYWVLKPPQT